MKIEPAKSNLAKNRTWLRENMNPYYFISMQDEPKANAMLERELHSLQDNRRLVLADRENTLILAIVNRPGTLYETLSRIHEREISYAMISHSENNLPNMEQSLEIQRFEFERKSNQEVLAGKDVKVPEAVRRRVRADLKVNFPDFVMGDLDKLLQLLWLNNENYVRTSNPTRVAQLMQLLQRGNKNGGFYLGLEEMPGSREYRVLLAVGNPPQRDFLLQIMEVFNRLELGVNRAYCLTINNGIHPYFLGTFYVSRRDGAILDKESGQFRSLRSELSITQILATRSHSYKEFVVPKIMGGEDAALMNIFIAFCHTNLAHNRPDRYSLDDVQSAFHSHPEISMQLSRLFRARFEPAIEGREQAYLSQLDECSKALAGYNTGHRYLDEVRRTIFSCCLEFIVHTLKTNFFVMEKQAVSFRLDPAYLARLGDEAISDLPAAVPFRVTFFFNRFGFGYHIGFSDIARGGWRTVIARTADDFITNANNLFRENFVLAHTQHLKNKDIYEGGSKLVTILNVSDLKRDEKSLEDLRLFKLQYGVTNAFLDIYVTKDGVALHPQVVDYYREDEPIELGPDENMHDSMVEAIAWLSAKRGYILGIGLMSSKKVGINHKEYGVTSAGVVKFAEITMADLGIDIRKESYSVKFTGGTNGDVAGNAMRLLLERSPKAQITLILDGTAALFDPQGADHKELGRILLKEDLDAFSPESLHVGGFMLFRSGSRKEGFRETYRKVIREANGLKEEWVSVDEFSREYGGLPFSVKADLFIPAGGRPETIDSSNWERFFLADGSPSARAVVEGANSFITPDARVQLQKRGVIIMRDASANKCGVISSSYEIIANLLLSNDEFLAEKERYVGDVLEILEKRAGDEARLILRRKRELPGCLYTEISDAISTEINANYSRLFRFFQARPELALQPLYKKAILSHLPKMLQEEPRFRQRIKRLPQKYLSAILAAEIGSSMVYRGDRDAAFEDEVRLHLLRNF
ncbi:MAG: NAD-glutamate dehydrogenase [Geobacteraceae bacterium]|nr:NAD-glutamate dehydrogenase [Geobacteraceae bacterium]